MEETALTRSQQEVKDLFEQVIIMTRSQATKTNSPATDNIRTKNHRPTQTLEKLDKIWWSARTQITIILPIHTQNKSHRTTPEAQALALEPQTASQLTNPRLHLARTLQRGVRPISIPSDATIASTELTSTTTKATKNSTVTNAEAI
jgi:hypothetical protein